MRFSAFKSALGALCGLLATGTVACGVDINVPPAADSGANAGSGNGGSGSSAADSDRLSGSAGAALESTGGTAATVEPGCDADTDCSPDICESRECVPAECAQESDCADGFGCLQGRCEATPCLADITFTYSPEAEAPSVVYLAGAFNGWSPTDTPMEQQDNGDYSVTMTLVPGTYSYKFVVDGVWLPDSANPAVTSDSFGGQNSVLNTDCEGVVATPCEDDEGCAQGFICEDFACIAAECAASPDCGPGFTCSAGRCSDAVCSPATTFVYEPDGPAPTSVHLAGSFNEWSTSETPLTQGETGWTVTLSTLDYGMSYEYKFVVVDVDGEHWVNDSLNLRTADGGNSLALIDCQGIVPPDCVEDAECSGGQICENFACVAAECTFDEDCGNADLACDDTGRCVTASCEYTFSYSGAASSVYVAGYFNGWNSNHQDWALTMAAEDTWQGTFVLPAGGHEYKFVVDGEWMYDPANEQTQNSNSFITHSCAGAASN